MKLPSSMHIANSPPQCPRSAQRCYNPEEEEQQAKSGVHVNCQPSLHEKTWRWIFGMMVQCW